MFGGQICVLAIGAANSGGFGNVLKMNKIAGRLDVSQKRKSLQAILPSGPAEKHDLVGKKTQFHPTNHFVDDDSCF